jgi:glutamyl/glutaminyl-tRNA synthetase
MNNNTEKKVITRFPPSPTGPLHIGNVRTALFCFLYARQHDGEFLVRVEDTDKARSEKKYEENMLSGLVWLGLTHDEKELLHQSERTAVYKSYLDKLIADGKAYISQETEGENKEVVRFKNPNKVITFEDLIRGTVIIDTTDLGDFIIARNINDPVYHLAVVVDDFEQGVTHIIRGEDHISNTPRHILIQDAIGAPRPVYAHLPLILASDRSKLSKRKHGAAVSLDYYREQGYLPEALVNYLALLGWNPGTKQELFTLDELIKDFDITKIQKGGAMFDIKKLDSINKEYEKKQSPEVQRAKLVAELTATGFFNTPTYAPELLLWKQDKDAAHTKTRLSKVLELLSATEDADFASADGVKNLLWAYAEQEGRGHVLWPTRVALSGLEKSPDPFTLASILGKAETIIRVEKAISML